MYNLTHIYVFSVLYIHSDSYLNISFYLFVQRRWYFCCSVWYYVCTTYTRICVILCSIYVLICMNMYVYICVYIPHLRLSCRQCVALRVWHIVLNCSGYDWLPTWHPFLSHHLPFQNTPVILLQYILFPYTSRDGDNLSQASPFGLKGRTYGWRGTAPTCMCSRPRPSPILATDSM